MHQSSGKNISPLSPPQAYISSAFFFFPERLAIAKFIRISMTQKTGVTSLGRCVIAGNLMSPRFGDRFTGTDFGLDGMVFTLKVA